MLCLLHRNIFFLSHGNWKLKERALKRKNARCRNTFLVPQNFKGQDRAWNENSLCRAFLLFSGLYVMRLSFLCLQFPKVTQERKQYAVHAACVWPTNVAARVRLLRKARRKVRKSGVLEGKQRAHHQRRAKENNGCIIDARTLNTAYAHTHENTAVLTESTDHTRCLDFSFFFLPSNLAAPLWRAP